MIGKRLGSYEIIEELGKGGMATVYRAYHPKADRFVAIKVIHRAIATEAGGLERFEREARLVTRLEHPHLLPVYDINIEHDPPYIVMRYLEGGTLKDVIHDKGAISLNEITHIMRQLGSALDYAHRRNVIHRDIKPSNIMIDIDGNAFLMDFGIARMTESKGVTQTGFSVGTPGYMSPEQGMGMNDITEKVDIYSLGVVLFEMATGRSPYQGDTPMAVLLKHIQELVPSAQALNPNLPVGFDEIINRSLAKEPGERYDSASDIAAALVNLSGVSLSSTPRELREAAMANVKLIQSRRKDHQEDIEKLMVDFQSTRVDTEGLPTARVSGGGGSGSTPSTPLVTPSPDDGEKDASLRAGKKRSPLLYLLGLIPVVLIVIMLFLLSGGNNQESEQTQTASALALLALTQDQATSEAATAVALAVDDQATDTPTRPDATHTDEKSTLTSTPENTLSPTIKATDVIIVPATPLTPIVQPRQPLSVRQGPGVEYTILDTIDANILLEVIGISDDMRWFKVLLPDGRNGWILRSSATTTLLGSLDAVRIVEAPTLTPTATPT
ncbi:hypothetical protein MASR2M15_15010 [Anaerolineales bacterium]